MNAHNDLNILKTSKYNFYKKISDDRHLIYSSLTNSVIVLNKEHFQSIKNPDHFNPDAKMKNELIKGGFLYRSEEDQMDLLKSRYNSVKSDNILSLSIVLTRFCNFDCHYCCVSKNNLHMHPSILEKINETVSNAAAGGRSIHITYFGGEPLLKIDLISKISSDLNKTCKKYQVALGQSIVTNGYLLNKLMRERLLDFGVNRVQITLDGPRDIHNKSRILKNGGGTFDVIMENIESCLSEGFVCTLKSLYDIDNYLQQYRLIDELVKRNIHKKLEFCPQLIKPQDWDREICSSCSLPSFSKEESLARLAVIYYAHKNDFKIIPFSLKKRYCTAEHPHVYFVDVDGSLYKCGFALTKEHSIGHISSFNFSDASSKNDTMFPPPFSDPTCQKCKLMPLCMGGCKYMNRKLDRKSCISAKYNFNKYLDLSLLTEFTV